ncbi:hypothetical protein EVAR_69163_1 [Eumeta japonica]|uniref:Uncharacterized protein n=1 Tax=Eumeta variegata TaxID=151549 RepID=A0A4C1ZIX4_EUMVA|nr:hypothetical protein EVAR_69163_1 [Eumeta japonica]
MKNTALLSKIYRRHHITATHICGCQRDGLAAALYWRATDSRGHVSTSLIIAKSRVARSKSRRYRDSNPGGRHGNQNGDHCYRGARQKTDTKFLLDGQQDRAHMVKERRLRHKPFVAHRRHRRK